MVNDALRERHARKEVRQSEVVAELVKNGIPAERAKLVLEMTFFPGGPPSTKLGMLSRDTRRN